MGIPGGSAVKNPPTMRETQGTRVQSLSREDPLEEEMATHSRILAWRIPWTEEPGGLQSMRLLSQTRLKRLSRQHFFSEGNREGHAAMTAYGKGMRRRGYFRGLDSSAPSVLSS